MAERNVDAQIAALEATVRAGFSDLGGRIDLLTQYQREGNHRTAKAHERLAAIEPAVSALRSDHESLRQRVHDLVGSLGGKVRADVRWIATIVSATAAIILGTLKLVGKL